VRTLEQGEAPLDQSIELYQEGDRLKRHCEARLKAAQARIEQIALRRRRQAGGRQAVRCRLRRRPAGAELDAEAARVVAPRSTIFAAAAPPGDGRDRCSKRCAMPRSAAASGFGRC
jgi:exodeoxyribonuclease VII small subunit